MSFPKRLPFFCIPRSIVLAFSINFQGLVSTFLSDMPDVEDAAVYELDIDEAHDRPSPFTRFVVDQRLQLS